MKTKVMANAEAQWPEFGRIVSLVVNRSQQDEELNVDDFIDHIRRFNGVAGSLLAHDGNMMVDAVN